MNVAEPLELTGAAVAGCPPDKPNVYSDGSVQRPGTAFAHAAFGVVFVDHSTDDRDSTERIVAEVADCGHPGSGLATTNVFRGLFDSSTQAELAEDIVGLLAQRPVHIAADNSGVIHKTCELLQRSANRSDAGQTTSPGKRPWALQ